MKKLLMLVGVYIIAGLFVTGLGMAGFGAWLESSNCIGTCHARADWYLMRGVASIIVALGCVAIVGVGSMVADLTDELLGETKKR